MSPQTDHYHYSIRGEKFGPEPFERLAELARIGGIDRFRDRVWKDGWRDWVVAGEVKGLFDSQPPLSAPAQRRPAAAIAGTTFGAIPQTNFGAWMGSCLLLCVVVFFATLFLFAGVESRSLESAGFGLFMALASFPLGILVVVNEMTLIYRMWAVLPGANSPSPGKAVGLLFIPLFNIYWLWVVYPGWVREYERRRDQHNWEGAPAVQSTIVDFGKFFSVVLIATPLAPLGFVLMCIFNPMATAQIIRAVNFLATLPPEERVVP